MGYLDPPDQPDPPKCPLERCDGFGEYIYDGKTGHVFFCDTCGYQWVVKFPPEHEAEPDSSQPSEDSQPQNQSCPHGKTGNCEACDFLSDIAYDTARERRTFKR